MQLTGDRPRRRRPVAVLAVLGTSLGLAGCGGEDADLAGRSFSSTEVRGHDLVEGSAVTLTFAEGRISARAGCNTLNGSATWDSGALEVSGPLASTMMACEEPLMTQDEWLSTFLTSSPEVELEGDTLTLGDGDDGLTLTEQG